MSVPMPHGPYRLEHEPIGIGGYALVYLGTHRETGEQVAIKKPRTGDRVGLARFDREVEVQTKLDHPNVMPILAHSRKERWLAMPLAVRNFTDAVERDRLNSHLDVVRVVREAARGLDYAHRQGYVHRDVNPNNILELGDPARWVAADWGLVRKPVGESSPRLTRRDKPLGTQGFIAPEALTDPHGANESDDVFSLGRVALFAVTGVWPRDSFPLPNPGPLWEGFIAACTAPRVERISTMPDALRLLDAVEARVKRIQHEARLAWMENQAETLMCPRCDLPITGARCENCGRVWD